jgi:DNA polymerase delta subunit 1
MVVFQALSWDARDVDDEYLISIFGRTETGQSVCLTTAFKPYFFVKLGKNVNPQVLFDKIKAVAPGCLESFQLLKKKDLWGFQNNEKSNFMKLNFTTREKMKLCDSKLRRPLPDESRALKVYEANLEPMLRFMHRSEIKSTGWLDTGITCTETRISRCGIDLFCNDWRLLKPVNRDDVAPFVVASFDIEAYSSTGKFPDADVEGDACFQIAFSLRRQGSPEYIDKTCLCYKKTNTDLEGCNIVNFETEKDLLEGFRDYVIKYDIDVMTGWNIFGFDLEFIFKRAIVNGVSQRFFKLGKLLDEECDMVYKKLSSSALGDNTLKLLPMSGRFIFDLFHEVKREQKLDSYTLNHVSKTFLGDQKIDMSAKEMFIRFREEDPEKLKEVAEYCIKDTLLPHQLMDRLCNFLNLVEMAKATWVPINYLSERGQQIKVFSQITCQARIEGFMVPTLRYGQIAPENYEGATVLEAQSGAYYVPITALDFASLYPSIMMAHNLCYSTLVLNPKYDNIPGVTYESFVIGGKTYKFAQNVPSLLPVILLDLKQYRKKAKFDMAQTTDPSMKKVYNGKQLAYKISMNSVYGFTGASKGILPCVAIASTVTCKGRSMIEDTKHYVEEHFPGSKVRYGDTDSVMIEFNVDGLTGQAAIDKSWELGEQAAEQCTKLFKKPNDLELEKVYYPYFLYSKKRYAAKMWTKNKQGDVVFDCIDIKGLQVVRRDNIPFVRETSKEILDIILESNNPESATECARMRSRQLIQGEVPIEKLILSQKLAESYKSDNMAHVRVRDKIRKREPGSEPQPGDRVPYVIIKSYGHEKQFEGAEDPKGVKKKSRELDYQHYFVNKFINPISDLLEPLVPNPKETIFGDLIQKKPKIKIPYKCSTIENLFKKYNEK